MVLLANPVLYFLLGFFLLAMCAVEFFSWDRVWATYGLPWMVECLVESAAILSVRFVGVIYGKP